MLKIIHQRDKCIGCFYCVEIAPQRWTIDENDGKSFLKESIQKKKMYIATVSNFEYEENKEAADVCPVNCIEIIKI